MSKKVKTSASAKDYAEKNGIDLEKIEKDGKITLNDVKDLHESQDVSDNDLLEAEETKPEIKKEKGKLYKL